MVIPWRAYMAVVTRGKAPVAIDLAAQGTCCPIRKDAYNWSTHRVKVVGGLQRDVVSLGFLIVVY